MSTETSNEANNCVIEFVHGRAIHVAHSPEQVEAKINEARRKCYVESNHRQGGPDGTFLVTTKLPCPPPLITLRRMTGPEMREARGFPEVKLNIDAIAGIYPLRSKSTEIKDL